ncbi:polyphosphate polymerase domain-containing protein [Tomitella gaofuii]|uniref:polyphosphate polymerase domain-containing protein n=1 Tax=Tomitella gaofuii TaxID=2760083 RepID=UPI0015FB82C2|nr:polyphosphate polymerase domain-containing protein [Tomitella gaofuii]
MPGYQSLRVFNRYEIKYLVDESDVPRLREELDVRLDADPYSGRGGYPVASLYYDTADLRFYWEKIEGLRFRRKLRLRLYGNPDECDDATTTHVEIKQRVNRVTQKRRLPLPYADALAWLDGGVRPGHDPGDRAFVDEVSTFVGNLDLRPIATTSYLREAYLGREADAGLRVTIDHRVRGRDRDFRFGPGYSASDDRRTVPPGAAVVEVKANERIPYWMADLSARLDMSVVRMSKYCRTIEAFELAPRSRIGMPEAAVRRDTAPIAT